MYIEYKQMNLDSSKDYIAGFVIIIVSLYAARTAPPLPNVLIEFIDTMPGRLLFITLIAFVVSFDIRVAIIISVAFTLTLMYVQNEKVKESFMNRYVEPFASGGDDVSVEDEHDSADEGDDGGDTGDSDSGDEGDVDVIEEEDAQEEETSDDSVESFTNYKRVTPYISNHMNQCPF